MEGGHNVSEFASVCVLMCVRVREKEMSNMIGHKQREREIKIG